MELKTHICRQLTEKGSASTQITLDDDYIVRDNKPDVVRVIYTRGDVLLEDTKAGNQGIWVTGKLHFVALYQTDDEGCKLDYLEGDVPFQEKLVIDEVEEADDVTVAATLEDLSLGIINSRKVVVRAVVSLFAEGYEERAYDITCGVDNEIEYEEKTKDIEILCLLDAKKDVIRMQKELVLPGSRTNIGEIIFSQIDFRNQDMTIKDNGIDVQMDAQVFVLYRSESTGEYECFESTVPLNGEIETDVLDQTEVFWAKISELESRIETREDYDGEARMLGMEVTLGVELQVYREEKCSMLMDAYSLEKELLLEREELKSDVLLMKNISKIRLLEQLQIDTNQERILQICNTSGRAVVDRIIRQEKGILLEGILFVNVLYNTTEDAMPFQSHCSQIPFEQFVEIADFMQDARVRTDVTMEQLQVNLLDNTEYEVKAGIQISVFVTRPQRLFNISHIEECELDMEALTKQPGIIGVVRSEGEELWDIAKKYHATSENIIELGEKVLVVKQVR